VLDADAEAFGWLSSYFTGSAVPVTVTNSPSGVTSIAAKNSLGQIVVFVMSNPLTAAVPPYPATSNETVDVEVKGTSWSTIVSAEALYASGAQSVSVGPVSVNTAITANKVTIGTKSAAEFTLDPGGSGRGSNAEIVKLILQ